MVDTSSQKLWLWPFDRPPMGISLLMKPTGSILEYNQAPYLGNWSRKEALERAKSLSHLALPNTNIRLLLGCVCH